MKKPNKKVLAVLCVVLLAGISLGLYFSEKDESLSKDVNAGKVVTATDDTSFVAVANAKQAVIDRAKEKEETGENVNMNTDVLDGIKNILLIGSDNDNMAGMEKLGNADGIMLVTVNNNLKQLTFTSFMRDTKIRQPREYEKKLTSIYHAGGTKLLIEALEQSFGIYIDQYIRVNYLNVMEIVDYLGGTDIELSADEIVSMAAKIRSLGGLTGAAVGENDLHLGQTGRTHLNGLQTTAYMRIRPGSTEYDRGRTKRAREVVMQILAKLQTFSTAEKSAFAEKFMPVIETNMTDSDIFYFSSHASTLMSYDMFSATIPLEDAYKRSNDGNFFVIPDLEVNSKYLYESIYEGKH